MLTFIFNSRLNSGLSLRTVPCGQSPYALTRGWLTFSHYFGKALIWACLAAFGTLGSFMGALYGGTEAEVKQWVNGTVYTLPQICLW